MAFFFEEVMAADVGKVAKVVEWLGDTGASRHVRNDLSLMQDVRTREKPILLRNLVGDIHVYTTGIVQLECPNDSRQHNRQPPRHLLYPRREGQPLQPPKAKEISLCYGAG